MAHLGRILGWPRPTSAALAAGIRGVYAYERLSGWRRMVALRAVLLIRALFARPVRHRGAPGGMALFWAGDALAVWSALAGFGFLMNGAAFIVGYSTGMVFTRRIAPLAGAGTLTLILPLPTANTGVTAYRLLGGLSLPPALASLPVLRETTRQAAITTHAVPGTATRPRAAASDTTAPASCARFGPRRPRWRAFFAALQRS